MKQSDSHSPGGLDDAIGSIEEGKTAHLLPLRENPLETVDAYRTIETVILHGQPIKRQGLSAASSVAPPRDPHPQARILDMKENKALLAIGLLASCLTRGADESQSG